jgi:choline dehydrogenase-like flavoprotein
MSYALELTKILLSVSLIITNRQQEHDSLIHRQKIDDTYDYIVIGAGSAGSVVASRLSERARIKVLIVDAGSAETVVSDMPSMTPMLWGSEMDWNFTISPQTNSHFGYNGNSVSYSQGKVMGGSSTINAMAYVRGLPLDFDNWKNLGVEGK